MSQILISGVRDLHAMTFLDQVKHAFNKINYEVANAFCVSRNDGKIFAVKLVRGWRDLFGNDVTVLGSSS